jgi:hypothetical protein
LKLTIKTAKRDCFENIREEIYEDKRARLEKMVGIKRVA